MSRRRSGGPRPLYLDCFSGAAGNMILGALLEVGTPVRRLRAMLRELDIEGLRMRVSQVQRGPLRASHVSFHGPSRSGPERRFREIRRLIQRSALPTRVRERVLAVFARLAAAEGRIHGVDPEQVHFHEVGALDAIGDIVGVCASLELLGVDRMSASPLPLGRGVVDTEHGPLPLPAPATLELLRGIPTYPAEVEWETVTPTGAALLAELCDDFGGFPILTPEAQGFGAGEERAGPLPNVLRACLGRPGTPLQADVVSVLETNLDDAPPEQLPFLLEQLMREGALDASFSPLSMKKGRPGHLLRVIARPADRERIARRILAESSAIGLRYLDMSRLKLARETRSVTTPYGRVRVKVAIGPDGRRSLAPEYDDCARGARRHGVPLADVYRAAQSAAERS